MKKRIILALLASSLIFTTGCFRRNNSSGGGGGNSGQGGSNASIDDGKIQINFYADYNKIATKEVYYSVRVENDSKLTKPTDPTEPPLPEFPVFKGWSEKQLIDDESELWDFDNDIVHLDAGYTTFNLFGFWAAEGE